MADKKEKTDKEKKPKKTTKKGVKKGTKKVAKKTEKKVDKKYEKKPVDEKKQSPSTKKVVGGAPSKKKSPSKKKTAGKKKSKDDPFTKNIMFRICNAEGVVSKDSGKYSGGKWMYDPKDGKYGRFKQKLEVTKAAKKALRVGILDRKTGSKEFYIKQTSWYGEKPMFVYRFKGTVEKGTKKLSDSKFFKNKKDEKGKAIKDYLIPKINVSLLETITPDGRKIKPEKKK